MKGIVFDIDHFAVHDGPGIRTTVYLKGCPLRCIWCHSPESQCVRQEVLYIASKCKRCGACTTACEKSLLIIDKNGDRKYRREDCKHCGRCVDACRYDAIVYCGREVDAEKVAEEATEDSVFYRNSGGGVTITGGEILAQAEFAIEILKLIKRQKTHTIVETSGMGNWEHLKDMIPFVDIFYYDVKVVNREKHKTLTGQTNDIILNNLKRLSKLTDKIVLRLPLIPGLTDNVDHICETYALAVDYQIRCVHLLPFNPSASAKYEWLGRSYTLGMLERQEDSYLNLLKDKALEGLEVDIIR